MGMRIRCLEKKRDSKGNIMHYILMDERNGDKFPSTGEQIKEQIKLGEHEFVNLQIDKAGRLVDKAEEKPKKVEGSRPKVGMTGVLTAVSRNGKKVERATPKDTVKNFLVNINEHYSDKISGVDTHEQFINDYTGRGNVAWDEELGRGCIKVKMPKEVHVYFEKLVKDIVNQAKESYVMLYDPFEEEVELKELMRNSHLPDSIIKFQKVTNCNFGIIKGLFTVAEDKMIASIRMQEDSTYVNWKDSNWVLTARYEYAKKYFKSSLANIAEIINSGCNMEVDATGNDLGQIFYIKYLAEVSGRTVDFYKQQIIEKAKAYVEFDREENKNSEMGSVPIEYAMQWALFGILPDIKRPDRNDREVAVYANAYMALKHNIIGHGDEDEEYCNLARKEAAELVKQL